VNLSECSSVLQVDIWSLGITLIECAEMEPPHHELSPMRVVLKIQRGEPPKLTKPGAFTPEFSSFLAKCLIKDPNNRPTAHDLLHVCTVKLTFVL
jgi:STE20-like kinase